MAPTAASSDFTISPTLGVNLATAETSSSSVKPSFNTGHTVDVGQNRVAVYARCDISLSGTASTATASVTITTSAGITKITGTGSSYTCLAQDGTATTGTYCWVVSKADKVVKA